ncbi:MAG: glutamate racemase [Candidatus Limnocylindrales bacterium]
MADARPIGFFDSGVGGLTVLREVMRRSPAESTVYLGDNLRAPYGPRSDDEVRRFSLQCLDELAARDVKAIVVACNTASAVALPDLRRRHDVPILGVVRPGASAAALATRTRRVGVVATTATIRSHAYFDAIKEEDPFVEVYEHATPELVPLVEAGRLDGPAVTRAVAQALAPLLGTRDARGEAVFPLPAAERIDTLLLGCTHYPLLMPIIAAAVGPGVAVIDSASATASALAGLLEAAGLAAPAGGEPRHLQLTTGPVRAFSRMAERLFGQLVPAVEAVVVTGAA